VSDYRFGSLDADRSRLIIETSEPVRVLSLEPAGPPGVGGVIALAPASAAAVLALQDEAPLTLDLAQSRRSIEPGASRRVERPIIVLDPGHGGRDPGAVAEGAALEKDVVLAVARRLKAILAVSERYDLRMTRDSDVAVALGERVAIASAAKANLFISIHADTFAGQPLAGAVRGGSVYILSDRASNRTAQALAEKENTADVRAGVDRGHVTGDAAVDSFLSDLMVRETQVLSANFQSLLVGKLRGVIALAREPARAAAFQVLKQPSCPAVLIELGYMSHTQDIALLQSPDWQNQVASAMARAVDAYFAAPRRVVGAP
jgi:N-acetylmuramoyl-L-alanine amidase